MAETLLIYKPEDVAQFLGLSRNTIYEMLRCGMIRNVKVGKCYLIPKDAVGEFLNGIAMEKATE